MNRINPLYFGSSGWKRKVWGWGGEKPETPALLCCPSAALREAVRGLGLGPDVFLWILQDGKQQGLPVTNVRGARTREAGVPAQTAVITLMGQEGVQSPWGSAAGDGHIWSPCVRRVCLSRLEQGPQVPAEPTPPGLSLATGLWNQPRDQNHPRCPELPAMYRVAVPGTGVADGGCDLSRCYNGSSL